MDTLFNYQYDFIKLKIYSVNKDRINWTVLSPHKNLKRHFTLNSGGCFCDNNFDLFMDKGNNITIRTSVPYLVHGHNYMSFGVDDLSKAINGLSNLLRIDLLQSKIMELEFGAYDKIGMPSATLIKNIVAIQDYQLERVFPTMKMFGDTKGHHFKIYDPVVNSKLKKTYAISQYPDTPLIKYEIKQSKVNGLTLRDLITTDTFEVYKKALNQDIGNLIIKNEEYHTPIENSLNHILYSTLKTIEQQFGVCAFKQTEEVIDTMELSHSQRSKRRKALLQLENAYNNQIKKITNKY